MKNSIFSFSGKLILASASPRRKELLSRLGVPFEIEPAQGEENPASQLPSAIVQELSAQKAEEIFKKHMEDVLVIGADTTVAFGELVFGKPKGEGDAKRMLGILQGKTHQVYTGVTLLERKNGHVREKHFFEKTDVTFYPMTETEIDAYVSSGEPMDKAGAYGIQGIGGLFVSRIDGDYNNVVGLPMARICRELKEWTRRDGA